MNVETLNKTIIACRKCQRLAEYREMIAKTKRRAYQESEYWGKPVPAFGDFKGRILAVGLAPGAHGSNRTGRMFTGDASGVFLFRALHKAGFASQPTSQHVDDELALKDILISAVCRCAPPDNKPSREEITNCLPYLIQEIELMPHLQGLVALGKIAFENILAIYKAKGMDVPKYNFKHGEMVQFNSGFPWIIASYHPSQQNTQTGRLSAAMFDQIWQQATDLLK